MCMRQLVTILAITLSGCVQGAGGPIIRPMSDEELTAQSSLVVEAVLESNQVVEYQGDPNLPPGWQSDPQLRELVEGRSQRVKLQLGVERWLKGTSAPRIVATKPASYEGAGAPYGVYAEASDEGFPDFRIGSTYRFWLRPDPVFNKEFIVIAARVP